MLSFCLMLVAALALGASPALGAQGHPYTGVSFGPDGVGGTESFENVGSLAVDPASGDVYVYDTPAGKIYKFDSAGTPVNFSATGTNSISGVGGTFGGALDGIALAPAGSPGGTEGDIYVANDSQAVHVYSPAGTELTAIGQSGETCGVATDPAGNFYAGVYSSTINKYTPTANPPTAGDKSPEVGSVPRGICNVATDGLGNVYAANFSGSGIYKLEGLADATPTKVDPNANTMGIAPGSNDLYANRGKVVVQYDSSGNELGRFGDGDLSESRGVAINAGATKIYAGAVQKVKVFGAVTTLPDTTTEAATEITRHGSTLHGTIGAAGGPDATCSFQYTTSQEFFSKGFTGAPEVPCSPAGPFTGSSSTPVSATITGLSQETEYRFRLVGSSETGNLPGTSLSFTTAGAVNVTTGAASALGISSATLNGTVNPEGVELEECFFEYGKNFALGSKVPCAETPAAIGNGNSPVAVHADLTGLDSATGYVFRLAGKNELGTSIGQFAEFKTLGAAIERESVAGVTTNSAIFKAQINPNSQATTYSFEYVSEADFNASGFDNATQLPSGGEAIGSGTVGVEVEQEATGLAPRTTYHLRVTASNASGDASAPEIVFSTFPTDGSGGLPDGRAYEQASSVKKDGGDIRGSTRSIKTSPNGDGITFIVLGGLPESEGGSDFGTFLSQRSASGWTTQGLLPSPKLGTKGQVIGLSEDLSVDYTASRSTFPILKRGFGERETDGKQYTPIWNANGYGWAGDIPNYKAASADNKLALFQVNEALTPEAEEGDGNEYMPSTYIWDRANQRLILAGVFNNGEAPVEGSNAGAWDYFHTGVTYYFTQEQHVLSADGSKFFFTDAGTHQLYVRVNPTQPQSAMNGEECTEADKACTYKVSKSQRSTPDPFGPQPAKFVTATADGSKVLFMSSEELTDDSNTGPEDNSNDLYSYDTNTHKLTDLTPSTLAENPNGGEVSGVLGISKDANYVYFGAGGVFAPGATPGETCRDGIEEEGKCNIYRWHEGDVTQLAQLEGHFWLSGLWEPSEVTRETPLTSRVSADGKTLMMVVPKDLTSYDAHGYEELYRFHVGDDEPLCVSCMPSGEEPRGDTTLQSIETGIEPSHQGAFISRNMSASGNRIFFESVDKLVGADTNGVKDVYEWEADGTGSCTSSDQNGGCLYLISTGKSPEPSYFGDAGESGNDAYFFTAQPLVGQDQDELVDVYDARVGGGLASQNPPPPSICTGEACRPGATPAPAGQTAGSSTFSGPGNPPAKKANHKKKHKSKAKKKHKSKKHHKKGAKSRQGGNR
jgi:hypothetical protein